ncbi:hypothetical protein F4810DRAFT_672055 [Camillea tinctor]|nr:hypothetical protein F4810DRAFT_672055 [Camillea tinctor]
MHYSALSSVALLLLSVRGTAATPAPNGYLAFFSTFNHAGCDIQSWGMTTVPEADISDCLAFEYPALSVSLDSIKEGCFVTYFPYADCGGRPQYADGPGCFNSEEIIMAARVEC